VLGGKNILQSKAFMRPIALLLMLALPACTAPPDEPVNLPLLGGYRDPADACRLVGESAATVDHLDDAADLVACPERSDDLGVFVTETGAIEVARLGGHVLYSVPIR
jgi:hypothetical protein